MDPPGSFGSWVRRRRKALDLTQADLARRVGCATVTIQKIESDERRPSRQVAALLAEQLRVPPGERAAFLAAARGELAIDRLPAPTADGDRIPDRPATAIRPHNLPVELTSFVGRTRELTTIASMLADARLLTLTGPGGTGKTRLALHLAAMVLERFPDGVWLVELAPLADPALIAQAIATVLRVREQPGRPLLTTLTAHLRDKQMLLVLDNCEHLIDACAQLADTLLHAAPQLRILASSREPLGIGGEAVFRVPALAAPDPRRLPLLDQLLAYETVQLFLERARAVQPAFTLTHANAVPLAQICARLDGIPLAIELAAARVRMLTVEQIAARLDDGFRLLTGGSRTALPRHQTLRALIDWSYDLLSAAEQALLRRLAVFVGGWTLEAAEAVCSGGAVGDVLESLTHLADKSLVQVEPQGVAARYRMLETIRQYALEKLAASGEADAVRARHAAFYLALGQLEAPRPGAFSQEWLDRLDPEHDNLRAALAWSQTTVGATEGALRLAVLLGHFWFIRGHWHEARDGLERALSHPWAIEHARVQAAAHTFLGEMRANQGDYTAGQTQYERALMLCREVGDRSQYAWVLHRLGWLAREQGDAITAWARLEESLALHRELGDTDRASWVLTTMGEVAVMQEDAAQATALLEASLRLGREHDSPIRSAWTLNHLGHAAQLRGEYRRAAQLHEQSLAMFEDRLGERHLGVAWAWQGLGETALAQGDRAGATIWLAKGLTLFRELGDRAGSAWCLAGLASAAAMDGQAERAARWWGAAEALRAALGVRSAPAARVTHTRAMATARTQLGEAAFAAAVAEGRARPLEQVIAEALSE